MMSEKKIVVPEENIWDKAHLIARTIISVVPYVGGPALEFFNQVIKPPIESRNESWANMITNAVNDLIETDPDLDYETLKANPLFISTMLEASLIAQRTHQHEKLHALRNAVINTASGIDIEENTQLIFLKYLDFFTPIHMKILVFLNAPEKWFKDRDMKHHFAGGAISTAIEVGIPELNKQGDMIHTIANDLFNRGLINTESRMFNASMTKHGMLSKRTKPLGEQFLKYIGV